MWAINQNVITSEVPIQEDTARMPISVQYGNDFVQDIAMVYRHVFVYQTMLTGKKLLSMIRIKCIILPKNEVVFIN